MWIAVALLVCVSTVHAQGKTTKVSASYKSGVAGSRLGVSGFGDANVIILTGAGDQQSAEPKEFLLPVDYPINISVTPYNLDSYTLSFQPPPEFDLIIDKVRRN